MLKIFSILQYQYERVKRLISLYRKKGLWSALSRVLTYGMEIIYLRKNGYLFQMEPVELTYNFIKKIPYDIRLIEKPVDLSHLIADLSYDNVQFRLRNGEYGLVVFHKQGPIGTIWLTNKPAYFPGFEFRIASKSKWISQDIEEGFVYRVAVDSKFRGNNILIDMFNAVICTARDLHIKRLIMSSGIDNVPLKKTAVKVGWNLKYIVTCRRFCGLLFRKVSPCKPGCLNSGELACNN